MDSLWQATHPLDASGDVFPAGGQVDAVVAGAGLTGLVTAVLLARAGQRVVVLEARRVGAVTTGATTGKLSLLQGTVLGSIQKSNSDEVLSAYVEANLEGQAWLRHFMEQHDVDFQERTAYSYATTPDGGRSLQDELAACRLVGLDVDWSTGIGLPIVVHSALEMPGQVQLNPMEVLGALAGEFRSRGGLLVEGVRVTGADTAGPVTMHTTAGTVGADRLVLATGTPILDRGGYFARLVPMRSYLTAFRVPGTSLPQGMYLSVDTPTRSLRTADVGGEELLLVGGEGHVVGRGGTTGPRLQELTRWTQHGFPGAERTHAWSAQDYRSVDRLPFVGQLPDGGGRVWVATGFNKWGLANAAAAGLNLSAQILGGNMPWAHRLEDRRVTAGAVVETVRGNAAVAGEMVTGWAKGLLNTVHDESPEGSVGRAGGKVTASSTVDGRECRVSGVCTHLGGIVEWNDAEQSWDCPLHGSRFAPDGSVLEGPATTPLPPAP